MVFFVARGSRRAAGTNAMRGALATVTALVLLGAGVIFTAAPAQAAAPAPASWHTPGFYDYTVPQGVTTLHVTVAGAAGGNRPISNGIDTIGHWGGRGDVITGDLSVSPGQQLRVWVGRAGGDGETGGGGDSWGAGGFGWGTGGKGGTGSYTPFVPSVGQGGGGGGGGSAIATQVNWDPPHVVAGGGGGAGGSAVCGGNPGGNARQAGYKVSNNCISDGGDPGGTGVTSSFSGNNGENANSSSGQGGGGGGGGGWRGGGGGDASTDGGGGGGGGTSFLGALTGSTQQATNGGNGYVTIAPVFPTETIFDAASYSGVSGDTLLLSGTVRALAGQAGGTPEGNVQLLAAGPGGSAQIAQVPVDAAGNFSFSCVLDCAIAVDTNLFKANFVSNDTDTWLNSQGTAAFSVQAAVTKTHLAVDPQTAVHGQSRELVATVTALPPATATPTGQVEFFAQPVSGGQAVLLGTAQLAPDGQAILNVAAPFLAEQRLFARFTGAGWFGASVSPKRTVYTLKAATAVVASVSPAPVVYGQPVTVDVTVQPQAPGTGVPGGQVTMLGLSETLVGGSAQFQLPAGAAGSNQLLVEYSGSAEFHASDAEISYQVERAATELTLSSSANSSEQGSQATVSVTANVQAPGSGVVSGSAQLWIDGVDSGITANFAHDPAQATFTLPQLSVGEHTLLVKFAGSQNNLPAISHELGHTITAAPVTPVTPVADPPKSAPSPEHAKPRLSNTGAENPAIVAGWSVLLSGIGIMLLAAAERSHRQRRIRAQACERG